MKTKDNLNMNKKVKGGILVEFALTIPVLVVTLYYASDVPRYSRYKSQMKNATYFAASMIQNISQNRTDKRIKHNDLKYIFVTAFLNQFNGLQQYKKDNYYPLKYNQFMSIYYIEGLPDKKARVAWCWHSGGSGENPNNIEFKDSWNSFSSCSVIKNGNGTGVAPSSIHKNLVIKEGEIKIIIEASIYSEGNGARNLGFHLLTPKKTTSSNYVYFSTVTIFTPQPLIFTNTLPTTL